MAPIIEEVKKLSNAGTAADKADLIAAVKFKIDRRG